MFVQIASAAGTLDLAARQLDEAVDRRGHALVCRKGSALAPYGSIDRPALGIDDVSFLNPVKVEQPEAEIGIEPRLIGLRGCGLANASIAQPDRLLRDRQVIHPVRACLPHFDLLPHQRHRIGAPAGEHQSGRAQRAGDQQNHRTGQQHACAEAPSEAALNRRNHCRLACAFSVGFAAQGLTIRSRTVR